MTTFGQRMVNVGTMLATGCYANLGATSAQTKLICRLYNEGSSVAHKLITMLHSKSTNVKWRIKVLRYVNLLMPLMSDSVGRVCPDEKVEFKGTFHDAYMKNFLSKFPCGKVKPLINKYRKRQKDFSQMEFTEQCLEQIFENWTSLV
ncbi:hypothetical protein ALC57_18071 [Trachymyrmex cornetzi]|uniref:Uncharacterized protein n=1 Tax=Trachymyrmex cornetzi TaxID=471704 RepID=A0A151ISL7_9HYME|nr:hypothetical protein ALC57_18071 [Trachymyrmex cornetzi]